MTEAQRYAEKLTDGERQAIRHIGSCGERGWYIHGSGTNWVTVAILNRRDPGKLFIGGRADYDDRWLALADIDERPEAYSDVHVRLTDFGKQVMEALAD